MTSLWWETDRHREAGVQRTPRIYIFTWRSLAGTVLVVHHHLNSTKERRNANFTMGLEKSHLIVHASHPFPRTQERERQKEEGWKDKRQMSRSEWVQLAIRFKSLMPGPLFFIHDPHICWAIKTGDDWRGQMWRKASGTIAILNYSLFFADSREQRSAASPHKYFCPLHDVNIF